jgi:uncharacterized membrane protein
MSYDVENSKVLSALWPLIAPSGDLLPGIALTAAAVVGTATTSGQARAVLGFPLLVVLPGYAVVSALFPANPGFAARRSPGLGTRLALSVGTSVAVVVPTAFVLAAAGLTLSTPVVVGALAFFSLGGFAVAWLRRLRLPAERRFRFPYQRWGHTIHDGLLDQNSPVDVAVNVALVVAVVLGVSALGYALVVPAGSTSFSSLSVLSESGQADAVAGNYSTDLVEGTQQEFLLAVENHEHETAEYTVVAQLQRVDSASGMVTDRATLGTDSNTVSPGETWNPRIAVAPSLSGDDLRVGFFLYTGETPEQIERGTADEHVYLWVDVTT